MQLVEVLELADLLSTVSSRGLAINLQSHPSIATWICHLKTTSGRLVIGVGEAGSLNVAVVRALSAFDTNLHAPITTMSSSKSNGRNLQKITLDDLE